MYIVPFIIVLYLSIHWQSCQSVSINLLTYLLVINRAIAAKYCMWSSHWHLLLQQKYLFTSTFDVLVLALKVRFARLLVLKYFWRVLMALLLLL